MSSSVRDVPEAPVLLPLLIVAFAVMLWRLHRGERFTWPRATVGAVACLYGVGVLKEVLQPFQIGIDRRDELGWRVFVHLTPLVGAELGDVVDNVALFVPLGVLLVLCARLHSARRVTLVGFVFSLVIETTQLVLDVTVSTGRVADVNDLLADTVGAAVGYALYLLAGRIPLLARPIEAMTWPRPTGRPLPLASQHQHET